MKLLKRNCLLKNCAKVFEIFFISNDDFHSVVTTSYNLEPKPVANHDWVPEFSRTCHQLQDVFTTVDSVIVVSGCTNCDWLDKISFGLLLLRPFF